MPRQNRVGDLAMGARGWGSTSGRAADNRVSRRSALKAAAGLFLAAAPAWSATPTSGSGTSMTTRKIPGSGEALPVVGLGTWQTFDVGPQAPERTALKEVLQALVERGGKLVDSSPMYGEAERVTGDLTSDLGLRDRLFLATKVWTSGRDAGIRQMEQSFKLMRAKRMDLMQIHNLLDYETHTKTLREWKSAGRVRYIGITHYHSGAFRELERLVKTRQYDFAQFNFSMAEREAEDRLLLACAESGTAVIVNRPFAESSLFGRVKGKSLPPWAADFDCSSWAQFFLKWILGNPAVTCVIPATRRRAHMEDNAQAGTGRLPDAQTRQRMLEYLQQV
jgi:diketogulonate reductase-like aldo/keto reductase